MKAEDVNPDVVQEPAKAGPGPVDVNKVLDAVVEAKSSTADEEEKVAKEKLSEKTTDTEKRPWHEDPRFKKDLSLLTAARNLMELNDLDSIEDLVEFVDKGKAVKGKNVDVSKLDEILEKAARLEKYEAYWEQQKKNQLREEDPDNYTKKLEEEIKELKNRDKAKAEAERAAYEAKKSVEFYERTVSELIEDSEDIPKEQHKFISLVMGISNPSNDIDITDRRAIKKSYNEILKSVKEFSDAMKQKGADEYRKGKLEIPKVAPTTPAAPVTEKRHNLKTAREALHQIFGGKSG